MDINLEEIFIFVTYMTSVYDIMPVKSKRNRKWCNRSLLFTGLDEQNNNLPK